MEDRHLPVQIPWAAAHSEEAVSCTTIRPCGSTHGGIAKVEGNKDAKEWNNAPYTISAMCDSAACDDGTRPPAEDNLSNEQNLPQFPLVHGGKLVRRQLCGCLVIGMHPQVGGWTTHSQPRMDEQSGASKVALVTMIGHNTTMGRI